MSEPSRTNEFGEKVRAKRVERNLTLRRFAEGLGVSPTYVSGFEKGSIAPPTPERIRAIADILETDPGELMSLASRWDDAMAEDAKQRPGIVALYRAAQSLSPEQLEVLTRQAEKLGETEGDEC